MTHPTISSPHASFPFPDAFSSALTNLFNTVQPGIVQVQNGLRGGGTGIIWNKDGRILTNNHVVQGEKAAVEVRLLDGRVRKASVLHRNPGLDLAVLKVTADNLQALPIGDSSKLRVGEWVFAVGHPWGQRWALTAGIVSRIPVGKRDGKRTPYITSDVLLAPGNSGGPLLDADGNVVGINSMIFGGDLSVSIPSNVISEWVKSLPKGRVTLGIEIQTVALPGSVRQHLHSQQETGLLVVGIGARHVHQSDLLVGDILLEFAGQPIKDAATLRHLLADGEEGKDVPMKLLRGGVIVDVEIATQTVESGP